MKKILAISGVILGAIVLSGCGTQTATTNPQPTVSQTAPAAPTTVSTPVQTATPVETPAPSMTPDSSTTNLPTTPAKTSDVDSSLSQVDKDLNSINTTAPNPNDLNSTDLQK
jgi:PBP1b-binding outer membrane lipoprotein LpoB